MLIGLLLINQASTASPACVSAGHFNQCTGVDVGGMCHKDYFMSAANTCTKRTKPIDDCIGYFDQGVIKVTETAKCWMCKTGNYAYTDETENTDARKYRCKTGDDGVGNCDYPGR